MASDREEGDGFDPARGSGGCDLVTALVAALVAGLGFAAAGLLGLFAGPFVARGRSVFVAVAGGILLALAFADLFPEAVEITSTGAVWGFVGGFALLLGTETATRGHLHHSVEDRPGEHALTPFLLGLGIHNLADGFVLGLSSDLDGGVAGAVGVGIFLHQIPTGLSLAAVLAVTDVNRSRRRWAVVVVAAAIPAAAVVTAAEPITGQHVSGVLLGAAAGVLTYISASHLLPETQRETRAVVPAAAFVLTLGITTLALRTVVSA